MSAFAFQGTNAHVVLEEAPEAERVTVEMERPLHVLVLSSKTPEALDAQVHPEGVRLGRAARIDVIVGGFAQVVAGE